LVVDAGVFFVTKQQLQTAVDAAALAAVWYHDICPTTVSSPFPLSPPKARGDGCEHPSPPLSCNRWGAGATDADCVADRFAEANMGFVGRLCSSVKFKPYGERRITGAPPLGNGLTYYVMEIECVAPYWFARVFSAVVDTGPVKGALTIRAHASATIGFRTQTGEASAIPPVPALTPGVPVLVARLAN
jgi:hypothetical protein